MELNFRENFFEGETIDGFYVEKEMKHAWAAQLKVLSEFDEVCTKHGLRWMAAYGTLLGAVRHKGFVPWDDDLDVWMPREDYTKFIKKAVHDLPKDYVYINIHNTPEHGDYLTRLVNHGSVSFEEDVLNRYYGCPYACGIDIFPLDYIPRDPNEFEVYKTLIEITASTATSIEEGDIDYKEQKQLLGQIEKLTRTKIDRGQNIVQQLRILAERICAMYGADDADNMGVGVRQISYKNYFSPKECYEITSMPFEGTMINVPVGYDHILTVRYGDYMKKVRSVTHDYPFYKKQKKAVGMIDED